MKIAFDRITPSAPTARDESWRTLRRWRSDPWGQGVRADTFRTALEQSEQYFRAAETVGYEVKPVLVFYGLYQAARAVAAEARSLSDSEYRLYGHGMSVVQTRDQTDLTKVAIKTTKKDGAPQVVARALGSDFLPPESTTALSDLWPLIPESEKERLPGLDSFRHPALAFFGNDRTSDNNGWDTVTLSGIPAAVDKGRTLASVTQWLDAYPSLGGWRYHPTDLAAVPVFTYSVSEAAIQTSLMWPYPKRTDPGSSRPIYVERACEYRGQRWVLPAVAGMSQAMHPLMAWWTVTLALSSLARYEPEAWARMVDVDEKNSPAVAIEHLLDTALDAIPAVVIDAISGS